MGWKTNWRWKLAQKLELIWWKSYLRKNPPADYLPRKRAYWERVLQETGASPHPGQTALDIGCGPAGIFMILDTQQVDALDPLLERYSHRFAHFDPESYPWVRFFSIPFEDWTPDKTYDRVFCLNAINHFRDLKASLSLLARVLAPDGRLLLTVDAHRSPFLKHLFQWLPGDALHPHQYTLPDYVNMLEAHDLRILSTHILKPGRIFDYVAIVARPGP